MTRTTAAAVAALATLASLAGCGLPGAAGADPSPAVGTEAGPAGAGGARDDGGSTPASGAASGGAGDTPAGGSGSDPAGGPGSDPTGSPGSDPAEEPGSDPTGEPAGEPGTGDLVRVLLLPVDLVAPVRCFTEGLSDRYVDGRGEQAIDPRPHGDLHALQVEYDPVTRLRMNSTERRVHLLPGSARAVTAPAGAWTVEVDVAMYLSGGFVIDYHARHHGEAGAFRERFTSPVDDTCTVEIIYGITTSALP